MATISVIFEISLQTKKINKNKSIKNGRWKKKYFVLLRNFNRPEVRLYKSKPQRMDEKSIVIPIHDGYQVFRKSQHKGKPHVIHLSTNHVEVFLWHGERHICDFICFFLRTLSKLRRDLGGCQSFIVRPERMEDMQRIGCFNSTCTLVLSRCGLTLALQMSGSIVGQWPLRCIRTFECSGRGRFVFEVGNFSPSGSTRLSFKMKAKEDVVLFDLIDELAEETARLESVVLDQTKSDQSRESLQLRAFSKEMIGLVNLTEVSYDYSFDEHLKKLSRDIYDHLRDHLGGRSYSFPPNFDEIERKHEGQSGVTSPRSLAVSPPPIPRLHRPSNISDEVFNSDEDVALKLMNYIDMKKDQKLSREAEEAPYSSSYLKPKCEKPTDLGSYIRSDKKPSKVKDNYSKSAFLEDDELTRDFEQNSTKQISIHSQFQNMRIYGSSKDRSSEIRLCQSKLQAPPHNNLIMQDEHLDRVLEVGDETYFNAKPKKDTTNVPDVPLKPLKFKLEKIKSI